MSSFLLFLAIMLILIGVWVLAFALKHPTSTVQAVEDDIAAQAKADIAKAQAATKKVF